MSPRTSYYFYIKSTVDDGEVVWGGRSALSTLTTSYKSVYWHVPAGTRFDNSNSFGRQNTSLYKVISIMTSNSGHNWLMHSLGWRQNTSRWARNTMPISSRSQERSLHLGDNDPFNADASILLTALSTEGCDLAMNGNHCGTGKLLTPAPSGSPGQPWLPIAP